MSTPKLAVPPPLRGADAGSFAEHSIVHRLPHIALRVVADNPGECSRLERRQENEAVVHCSYIDTSISLRREQDDGLSCRI